MAKQEHGKTFFLLGLFALAALIVMVSFLGSFFRNTIPGSTTNDNETVVSANEMDHDPLVTVVPRSGEQIVPTPLDTDPSRGPKNAPVTIIEFGDFQCANCAEVSGVMTRIVNRYPDQVRHVWKDFPLNVLHPQAIAAAEAAHCANVQGGFWQYHDLLFLSQLEFTTEPWVDIAEELEMDTDAFQECLESEETGEIVTASYLVARSLGVQGTPTLYINDQVISGNATFDEIQKAIDEELDNVGQ